MAGARITATLDDEQFCAALDRLASVGRNPTPVLRAIGVGLQHVTIDRFEAGRDPTGNPWKYSRTKTICSMVSGAPNIRASSRGSRFAGVRRTLADATHHAGGRQGL